MIWIAHSVYLIVFVVFLFAKSLNVQTREEFAVLPAYEKDKIYNRPWTFVILTICFLIMDCIVRTLKGGTLGKIFVSDLIPALLFIWMLLLRTKKGCGIKKLRWLPYVLFFVFTLIRNIVGHERVIGIILTEVRSLALLGAFAFVCQIVLADPRDLPTMEEKAKNDAEYKQRQDEKQQREYEKQLREEQARIQAEKDARTHEAYERIVLGKKTSRSSYGSSYNDDRESSSYREWDFNCSGCLFYDIYENRCECSSSLHYWNHISNPSGYSCNHYRGK
ncbi:MAG: hypothetical protein IJ017_06640 [Oscillospiraceae bacterium]|nr:hypothetical protein [Oscillospiraceae bacterium]